jgi:hypothetical protein
MRTLGRKDVVRRSAEEFSIEEPIEAPDADARAEYALHGDPATVTRIPPDRPAPAGAPGPDQPEPLFVNPFRAEPSAAVIATVKRFGRVGLVACALGAAVLRWVRSRKR